MRTNSAAFGQPPHPASHTSSYYQHHHAPQHSYAGGAPMYYQQPIGGRGDHIGYQAAAGYDNRKRSYDVLHEFFNDTKRRQLDPTSYQQVSQRLVPLHGALPIHAHSLGADYLPAPAVVAVDGPGGAPYQHYALPPMPELRTKNDLVRMDQMLEQMQSTIYESSNSPYIPLNMRHSHSPPHSAAQPQPSMAAHNYSPIQVASPIGHLPTHTTGTPVATPPSSYTTGHSPSASSAGYSPSPRHNSTTYPTLPAVTSGYPGQTPTSTLGPSFDTDPRRYPSTTHQRANVGPRPAVDREGSRTPKAPESALSAVSSPSAESERSTETREREDQAYEVWLENVRTIEYLREYVNERLRRKEFDAGSPGSNSSMDTDSPVRPPSQPAYPALPLS
jgi:hypothetical protein